MPTSEPDAETDIKRGVGPNPMQTWTSQTIKRSYSELHLSLTVGPRPHTSGTLILNMFWQSNVVDRECECPCVAHVGAQARTPPLPQINARTPLSVATHERPRTNATPC